MTRLLICLAIILLAQSANAGGLVASVDRATLAAGQTVELMLDVSEEAGDRAPDLRPLERQFTILSSRRVASARDVGADASSSLPARWVVTLRPRRSGYLNIPTLWAGGASSEPITLYVQQTSDQGEQLAPVFIDASLDVEDPYVQAQVVLTLRIYHSIALYDDSHLSPLQMTDAHVEQLGEARTYERTIGKIRHGVIELRYAIYPQRSGEMTIPGQMFSATLVDRSSPDEYQPFGPRPGKLVRVTSPEIPLQVRPRPPGYPSDAPWLPARNLTLSEAWTPEPTDVQVGASLTRNVMLRAEGLSSVQLPALPEVRLDGLRTYPDQPRLGNQSSDQGLTGSREEGLAVVPTRAGSYELPAVDVVWWNTVADRLEHSVLPARQLQVAGVAGDDVTADASPASEHPVAGPGTLWAWQLATALLLFTTLWGFALWWRARRLPAVLPTPGNGPSVRSLLEDLRRACGSNDPQATRHALDAWARQQPDTLADLSERHGDLAEALNDLNGALYSETGQNWQGAALWQAIRDLPETESGTAVQDDSTLPPLYPR